MTLDVRELVRRLRAGEPDRAIARDLTIARKTVAKYRILASQEGFPHGTAPRSRGTRPPAQGKPAALHASLSTVQGGAVPGSDRGLARGESGSPGDLRTAAG